MNKLKISLSNGKTIRVALKNDFYGEKFWEKIEKRQYEPDTLAFIENNIDSSTVFLDVGAANGAMTLLAANLNSNVFAFEPNPLMAKVIRENLFLNPRLSNLVNLRNEAISSGSGEIRFQIGADSRILSSIVFGADIPGKIIKVRALSEVLESVRLVYPNKKIVIKMDIEGAEWKILKNKKSLQALLTHNVLLLLAVHPGFYRPPILNVPVISRVTIEIHRFRNFLESIRTFRNLNKLAKIFRTNLNPVVSSVKFALLIEAGYHEFIINFGPEVRH